MTKYHCQRINLVASAGTVTSLETTKKKNMQENLYRYMLKPIPTATSTTPDFLLSIIINYISCVCASVQ